MRVDAPSNIQLSDAELALVHEILFAVLPDAQVLAYGSRVKGTARPYSDLDLAIVTEEPVTLSELRILRQVFDESMLPLSIDLVDWNTVLGQVP